MKIIRHRVTVRLRSGQAETQKNASFLLFKLSERPDALVFVLFAESAC